METQQAPRITWIEDTPRNWYGHIEDPLNAGETVQVAHIIQITPGRYRLFFNNPYFAATSDSTNPNNIAAVKGRAQKVLDDAYRSHQARENRLQERAS